MSARKRKVYWLPCPVCKGKTRTRVYEDIIGTIGSIGNCQPDLTKNPSAISLSRTFDAEPGLLR